MATRVRSAGRPRLFESRIDLPVEKRSALVALLNQELADIADLRSQAKQAHWNVKGEHFYSLHLLFDEIAAELDGFADMIAERAVTLGGVAHGTVRDAAAASRLEEYPSEAVEGLEHVDALVARVGDFANHVRSAVDKAEEHQDQATMDLLTEILRAVDKRLWFLEAHLQGRS
jgi:starvation-inducible DNA-binding protein